MKYKIPSEFKITRVRECASSHLGTDPQNCFEYWNAHITTADWFSHDREHLVTLLCNARLRIIGHHLISIGTTSETIFHPREVLRPAIMHSAYGFMVMHNHPSGDPSPSAADNNVTKRLREAANLMNINFIDHIIAGSAITGTPYFSFREAGII